MRSTSLLLLFLALFNAAEVLAVQPVESDPRLIELFTTTEIPVVGKPLAAFPEIETQIYELDGIQRFETRLSHDLPADPKQARQIAMQRLQQWDEATSAQLQQAAMGMAKAMQYGIDRYPAIVFDGRVVAYGLTDLNRALDHYWAWQAGERP